MKCRSEDFHTDAPADEAKKAVTGTYTPEILQSGASDDHFNKHDLGHAPLPQRIRKHGFKCEWGLSQGSEQSRTQGTEEVWKDDEQDLSQDSTGVHTQRT